MPMMHTNDDYTYALWRLNEPSGSIVYDEAGKHDLHLTSAVTIGSGAYKQYSKHFITTSPAGMYASYPLNHVFTSSWTVEFIGSIGVIDSNMYYPIFSNTTSSWVNSGDNGDIQIVVYQSDLDLIHLSTGWESGSLGTDMSSGWQGTITGKGQQNAYSHYAVVKNVLSGGLTCNVRYYIDGVLVSNPLTLNNASFGSTNNKTLKIGGQEERVAGAQAGYTTKGYLSGSVLEEVRLSNCARTELEIKDSSLRAFRNSIHSGPPIVTSITRQGFSGSNDFDRNETRIRLNFSKHMSMVTLATASNYEINPNTATISSITASFEQTYTDLLLTNVNPNITYYVTASTNLVDIDGNNIQSGSNVVPFRFDVVSRNQLINIASRRKRLLYHMRGKSGSTFVYWNCFDNPDKNGILAPETGLTDIVIDNVSYDPA